MSNLVSFFHAVLVPLILMMNKFFPSLFIYVSVNWVSIGSGNGLSPVRRQTITGTNADILSTNLETNFNEILIDIHDFSLMKMHLKMSSEKWRPFCPGGDELRNNDSHLAHIVENFQRFILLFVIKTDMIRICTVVDDNLWQSNCTHV